MQPTSPDWTGTRLSLHRQAGTAVLRLFNPQELLALGLVSACADDMLAYALRLAEQIGDVPARACANIKRLVRNARRWSRDEGLAAERTPFCDCMVDPLAQPLMADVACGERTIADKPTRRVASTGDC